jgi:hypothetical protein
MFRLSLAASVIVSQSKSLGFSWLMAVRPWSEQPAAARTPKPGSVKW